MCVSTCVSFFPAGWQVNKGEDVVLDEAGEAQKDGIQQETHEAQTFVQRPLVEMDSQNLDGQKTGGRVRTQQRFWDASNVTLSNTHGEKHGRQKEPNGEDQTFTVQLDLKQNIITMTRTVLKVNSRVEAEETSLLMVRGSIFFVCLCQRPPGLADRMTRPTPDCCEKPVPLTSEP